MIRVIKNPTTTCFGCGALLEFDLEDIDTSILHTDPDLVETRGAPYIVQLLGQITCPECQAKTIVDRDIIYMRNREAVS